MELLSQSAVEALLTCGDSDAIADGYFPTIAHNAMSCVLDTSRGREILSDPSTAEVDPSVLKQSYPALMTLFIEAAKTDTGSEQLNMILDDCKLPQKRKETLLEIYKANKQKLRANLALIGRGPSHVVDVDWRLDYNLKNSQMNKVMELQYNVALKTEQMRSESHRGDKSDIQFSCTREQLQDFVGKLKEAVKAVEKASQS